MKGQRTRAPVPEEKARDIKAVLSTLFPGREEQAEIVVLGLATGLPVFLMSPPGTGKTKMIDYLARLIDGANYFYYLLNRFTEPDELLGPVDIKALREGIYKRNTKGRLPEAHIVMLDEIFKASSAIRNVLLDIMLNKRMPNGNGFIQLPMKALFTASNETPEDEEDWALYDRLVLRSFFSYVQDDLLEKVILQGIKITVKKPEQIIKQPVMTLEDVDALQRKVSMKAIEIAQTETIRKKVIQAITALRAEGIEYSDRRSVQVFIVLAGIALLRGNNTPTVIDIADAFTMTAPQTQEHMASVEQALQKAGLYASQQLIEQLNQLISEAENLINQFNQDKSIQTFKALAETIKKINSVVQGAPRLPPSLAKRLEELKNKFDKAKEELQSILQA